MYSSTVIKNTDNNDKSSDDDDDDEGKNTIVSLAVVVGTEMPTSSNAEF